MLDPSTDVEYYVQKMINAGFYCPTAITQVESAAELATFRGIKGGEASVTPAVHQPRLRLQQGHPCLHLHRPSLLPKAERLGPLLGSCSLYGPSHLTHTAP